MSQPNFLNDVYTGPDLYVNWPRTNNTFPWDETYKPTPYFPSGDTFYDWNLYRLPQTEANDPYFMSQEVVTGTDEIPATQPSQPTSCSVGTPVPQCPNYDGQPLPSIHDPYKAPQITITDRAIGGCGALFKQETVNLSENKSDLTQLAIFLLLGGVIAYAVMLALRK